MKFWEFKYIRINLISCKIATYYFCLLLFFDCFHLLTQLLNLFMLFTDSLYCKWEVEDGIILVLF